MKDLKGYIKEGLFDDIDKLEGKKGLANNIKVLKNEIISWIINNTAERVYKNKLSVDMTTTPPTVDYNGTIEFNTNITSLTNGMFQWGKVDGKFYCRYCSSLESLEGGPKKVSGDFRCSYCNSLTTLKGAPEEVGGSVYCSYCKSLKSIEDAPKKVGGGFSCCGNKSLKSLKGAPEELNGGFNCSDCPSLTSLKGAPKKVGMDFSCRGIKFTDEDVRKVSEIKGFIYR
jgi:hypothetical protein